MCRNLNNFPFAAFVGADAVEDTLGFEDGEVTLHTLGSNAYFFREGAGGVCLYVALIFAITAGVFSISRRII